MSTQRPDWQNAHDRLSRLAKERARLDCEEGSLLLQALRRHVHLHLGFASFAEYVERLFGYSPRWTKERLRVAEALESLPRMQSALRDGSVSWSTARELTRVATPESEQAWLEVAGGKTMRQVEQLVAGHAHGALPDHGPASSLVRHALRFDVSAETFATFREAVAKLRRDSDGPLDDDTALLLMARHLLGGPSDEGRANYQVQITVCRECQRGWQQGRGEQIEVGSEIVEMANCDVQHVGQIAVHAPHVGGAQVRQDDCAEHSREVRAVDGSARAVDNPAPVGERVRARQNVPPAVRREVLRRDGGRCVVPGCRHATFLDLHHVIPRAEGGDHDPDTLISLCAAHHRAQHRGLLMIEGRVSSGMVFRHADGSAYGTVVNPMAVDTYAQVFRALRTLGFREREARAALAQVRAQTRSGAPVFQTAMREALAVLTERARSWRAAYSGVAMPAAEPSAGTRIGADP